MIRAGLAALTVAACTSQPAARATPAGDGVAHVATADAATQSASPAPAPDAAVALRPFRIEYRAIALLRCKGNRRVKIEDDGRVFAVVQAQDCRDRSQSFTTPYPPQPLRTLSPDEIDHLAAAVSGSGLLALPGESVNERRKDGRREEIELQLGGRTRTIATQNLELPAFARVRDLVLRAAG